MCLADEIAHYRLPVRGTNGSLRDWSRVKEQRNSKLKIIVSIGGMSAPAAIFVNVASNEDKVEKFAQTLKSILDEYSLDGVDSRIPLPVVSIRFISQFLHRD